MLKTYAVAVAFFIYTVGPCPWAQAQGIYLPAPGTMVELSPAFDPPVLVGVTFHPDNAFQFDFLLNTGDRTALTNGQIQQEGQKLISYFLASLTTPEQQIWVNLSPYEKERIVPYAFGQTEMGQTLLEEDYLLKQIMATALDPEKSLGEKFWQDVYAAALKEFGTTNVPVNTFNKVWIVPDKAVVYENGQTNTVFVVESSLKVMLDRDYLAARKHRVPSQDGMSAMSSQVIKQVVIPALKKEVNEGHHFAPLRQVYQSMILAKWYKDNLKQNVLARAYADRNKILGVEGEDKNTVNEVYHRYLRAYRKGVYNFIKEELDPTTQTMIPRKYFSGGVVMGNLNLTDVGQAQASQAMLSLAAKTNFLLLAATVLVPLAVISSPAAAGTINHNPQGQILNVRVTHQDFRGVIGATEQVVSTQLAKAGVIKTRAEIAKIANNIVYHHHVTVFAPNGMPRHGLGLIRPGDTIGYDAPTLAYVNGLASHLQNGPTAPNAGHGQAGPGSGPEPGGKPPPKLISPALSVHAPGTPAPVHPATPTAPATAQGVPASPTPGKPVQAKPAAPTQVQIPAPKYSFFDYPEVGLGFHRTPLEIAQWEKALSLNNLELQRNNFFNAVLNYDDLQTDQQELQAEQTAAKHKIKEAQNNLHASWQSYVPSWAWWLVPGHFRNEYNILQSALQQAQHELTSSQHQLSELSKFLPMAEQGLASAWSSLKKAQDDVRVANHLIAFETERGIPAWSSFGEMVRQRIQAMQHGFDAIQAYVQNKQFNDAVRLTDQLRPKRDELVDIYFKMPPVERSAALTKAQQLFNDAFIKADQVLARYKSLQNEQRAMTEKEWEEDSNQLQTAMTQAQDAMANFQKVLQLQQLEIQLTGKRDQILILQKVQMIHKYQVLQDLQAGHNQLLSRLDVFLKGKVILSDEQWSRLQALKDFYNKQVQHDQYMIRLALWLNGAEQLQRYMLNEMNRLPLFVQKQATFQDIKERMIGDYTATRTAAEYILMGQHPGHSVLQNSYKSYLEREHEMLRILAKPWMVLPFQGTASDLNVNSFLKEAVQIGEYILGRPLNVQSGRRPHSFTEATGRKTSTHEYGLAVDLPPGERIVQVFSALVHCHKNFLTN